MFFSKFDKLVVLFFVVVFAIVFVSAANVDPSRPFHLFTQIAVGVESVTDSNGVLLSKFGGTGVAACADGNVLKWSGAQNKWVCGGTILSTGGTPLPTCQDGNILKYFSGTWVCGTDNNGAPLPLTCLDGNVLKWNATQSKWICGTDNNGNSLPTCLDGNVLKYNVAQGKWVCGTDLNGGESVSSGCTLIFESDPAFVGLKRVSVPPSCINSLCNLVGVSSSGSVSIITYYQSWNNTWVTSNPDGGVTGINGETTMNGIFGFGNGALSDDYYPISGGYVETDSNSWTYNDVSTTARNQIFLCKD
ncbi:MAG: hypothetical protein NTY48_00430 [Candidatus Diapherotrites archaeon]|nr:hypothetical protein [Candidatus Diapherotrites archaeon]